MKKSRAIALVAVSASALALSSQAMAGDLWWSSMAMAPGAGPTVSTANADGSGLNENVFSLPSGAAGVGVVTRDYVYYVKSGSIGRVKLDGTGAENTLINAQIPGSATTIMGVDGTTLYWLYTTQSEWQTGVYHIGKANLDGTGADTSYISGQQSTPARCGTPYFAVSSGYAFVRFPPGTGVGQQGQCSVGSPTTGGVDRLSLATRAVDTNYYGTNSQDGGAFGAEGLAANATSVFGLKGDGQQQASGLVYSAAPTASATPTVWQTGTSGALGQVTGRMTASASTIFFIDGQAMNPRLKSVSATQASGGVTTLATLTGQGSMKSGLSVQVDTGSSSSTTTPAATPAAPAAAPVAATALRAPTQTTTADSNGNVAVTVALQLDEIGQYTFLFEKVTSNEMSREAASSSRISMQKGTKIGKRKLAKVVSAANVTTTKAGAKLVMVALLKKAQAKKWNLRVIHHAADGTLAESVIAK